jgi:hypothetical protein
MSTDYLFGEYEPESYELRDSDRRHALQSVISTRFSEDGFVCLRNIVPRDAIDKWHSWSSHHFAQCFRDLYVHGHTLFPFQAKVEYGGKIQYAMEQGVKNGFKEIVMRSPGRYEISVLNCKKHPSLNAIEDEIQTIIPPLLSQDSFVSLQLCHLSLVIASPSASDQSWHADGGHVDIQRHLPCHCLNVFIPLTDITSENGPTELRPSSHFITRKLAPMMLAAKAKGKLHSPVTPTLRRGDVLIFDYRILHRGRANVSDADRPILVLTYAKSWFKDVCNFPKKSLYESRNINKL